MEDVDKGVKYIPICAEDVMNLKCAEKRILDTLDNHYEALEVFTLQRIIRLYEKWPAITAP